MLAKKKQTAPVRFPFLMALELFLYRSPEPRPLWEVICEAYNSRHAPPGRERYQIRHFPTDGPGYTFYLDKLTLNDTSQPLWYHTFATCMDSKPFPLTHFHKNGGGGVPPRPTQECLPKVFSEVREALRQFPCGWTECEDEEDGKQIPSSAAADSG